MDCHELPMRLCHCDHVRSHNIYIDFMNYDIEIWFSSISTLEKRSFCFFCWAKSDDLDNILISPSSSDHRFFSENFFASFSFVVLVQWNALKRKKFPDTSDNLLCSLFVKDYEEAIKCTWRFCPTFHKRRTKNKLRGRMKGKKFNRQKINFPIWETRGEEGEMCCWFHDANDFHDDDAVELLQYQSDPRRGLQFFAI